MLGSESAAEIKVNEIFNEVDADHNNLLEYTEFVAASIGKDVLLTKSRLQQAFNLFDKDKSGKISSKELRAQLGGEKKFNEQIWTSLIVEVDKNGDGEVDFQEFCDMMNNIN